jgi:flagellar biosynthetic protein FliP
VKRPVPLSVLLALVPALAHAQSLSLDLGAAGPGATSRIVQLTALITVLSLAPSLLVMATAFTRIVIVLSLLRSSLGAQNTPPNVVLIGLALFLTFFVMQPVLDQAWQSGLLPMTDGAWAIWKGCGWPRSRSASSWPPACARQTCACSSTWRTFRTRRRRRPHHGARCCPPIVGELRRAFEMGFLLYLPFLVIDMVVASVLMGLGMMMLPPNVVSLPFKLIFFVLVDGWRPVGGSLVQSFAVPS